MWLEFWSIDFYKVRYTTHCNSTVATRHKTQVCSCCCGLANAIAAWENFKTSYYPQLIRFSNEDANWVWTRHAHTVFYDSLALTLDNPHKYSCTYPRRPVSHWSAVLCLPLFVIVAAWAPLCLLCFIVLSTLPESGLLVYDYLCIITTFHYGLSNSCTSHSHLYILAIRYACIGVCILFSPGMPKHFEKMTSKGLHEFSPFRQVLAFKFLLIIYYHVTLFLRSHSAKFSCLFYDLQ